MTNRLAERRTSVAYTPARHNDPGATHAPMWSLWIEVDSSGSSEKNSESNLRHIFRFVRVLQWIECFSVCPRIRHLSFLSTKI